MDLKTRAELVRAYRAELKRDAQSTDPRALSMSLDGWNARDAYPSGSRLTSRNRIERARTRSRFQRVRADESGEAYIDRTAEGGDSSYALAAERYDLRNPHGDRAPTWSDDGYAWGYDGRGARARRRNR